MSGHNLIGDEELNEIKDIFENSGGVIFAHGFDSRRRGRFRINEVEQYISSNVFGSLYATLVSSGTAALKVALKSVLGDCLKPTIVIQSFNFIAVAEVVYDLGGAAIYCPADNTLNMSPKCLDDILSNNTVHAVVATSMLGVHPNLSELNKVCNKFKVPFVVDACEALGSKINGYDAHKFCDIAVYSFDFGKTITCGEGGALVYNSEVIHAYAKSYRDHGHAFVHSRRNLDLASMPGFNYRLTEIQAAILSAQAKKLKYILEEQRVRYDILFSNSSILRSYVRPEPEGHTSQCDVLFCSNLPKSLRDDILGILSVKGFSTKNVPDSLRWHTAYYWDHIDPFNSENKINIEMLNTLETCLAINIDITFEQSRYLELAESIDTLN